MIILILMPLISIVQQFTYPTQSSVLPKIIEEDSFVKANSLMTFTYQVLVILFTIASGIIISQYGAINMLITSSALSMCTTLLYIFIKIPEDNRGFDGINIKEVFYEYKQELYKGSLFIKNSFIPKFLMGSIIANFLL